MSGLKISASLSCMDLLQIGQEMDKIEKSSIEILHYDVVDGKFAKCLDFGDLMLETIRPLTVKPVCVHLMVTDPVPYIERMHQIGANQIAFHYESEGDPVQTAQLIRSHNMQPILAFCSRTEIPENFIDIISHFDGILKLTVDPGFAGQKIQLAALEHIRQMRKLLDEANLDIPIECDGNMNTQTIPLAVEAGAQVVTGGSSGLFKKGRPLEDCIRDIRACEKSIQAASL